MVRLILWIATPDKETANRWYNLFSRECFQTIQLLSLSALDPPPESWGLIFAEIGVEGMAAPKDLNMLLQGRKNISVIVFSGPGKTGNALISGFLESGADDFITTDIDEKVLLSKTKAHIRRLLPNLNAARTIIVSGNGDIEIDRLKRTVKTGFSAPAKPSTTAPAGGHSGPPPPIQPGGHSAGQPAHRLCGGCGGKSKKERIIENLTPKEFDIFSLLLCKEGEIVPRSFLMEELWKERSGEVNCETIDKHVETLRRKLGPYGKNIKTVYGAGYVYKAV
ncbi:MAG: winged helix-turn-helix domain-containing protein [Elusimicrobia bacterium]|nr:winged helix-turn-helix domain-containing protein [Elusimicrobiota bacterium]